MKLMSPLKTPTKNAEQRIFKLVLFIILPLMAIVTVYSFARIDSKKNSVAEQAIRTQGGNANKRITLFFDPIFRDIGYLQALGNTGELNPNSSNDTVRFLQLYSESYLQHTQQVIFWDGKHTFTYKINEGEYTRDEGVINPEHLTFLDGILKNKNVEKVEWEKGTFASSVMAAIAVINSEARQGFTIATDIDVAGFYDGLKDYMDERLFLLSSDPIKDQLPRQFIFTDENDPDIETTNDAVIIAAYTQWKKDATQNVEIVRRMVYDGKAFWVSIRPLDIVGRDLYSGYILAEAEMLSELIKTRRNFAIISLISFAIVLIATVFLWRRYQRDIEQSTLPPAVNEMTDDKVLQAIAAGEDDRLEFKSTLRWNLRTNKPDKAMEIACLKTMAAFLNSEGGTLLVGVEDDGNILGIGADQFPNEDKFLLHFNNLINQHLGLETTDSFSFDIRHLETGDIMIVDCLPSPAPVYVTHDKKEDFYVRVGPGTRPLTTRDALEYIRNHF
ncbi:MAG: AlbA family DNA-binding domain-containing protein [Planctomycetota bacterium]|jgi:hypothetical protein